MNGRFPLLGGQWSEEIPYRGALLIPVDKQGRILLQLRDYGPNTVHPGKWSLFGGEVEEGETLDQAAVREFREEVGVCIAEYDVTPFARILSTPGQRRIYVFYAELDITPADITLGEGAGFGFIEPANVTKLDLIPFAKIVLQQFVEA